MYTMRGWAVAAVAAAMLGAAPAGAQGGPCDRGRGGQMTDLGFASLRRADTAVPGDAPGDVRFTAEPRISGVRPTGPAAGKLREGDRVVAVDGQRITTPAGARRYAQVRPGERVLVSVRRDGRVREVAITALGQCVPIPPAPPVPEPAPPAPDAPAPPVPPSPEQGEIMPEGWMGFMLECRNCGEDEDTGTFRFLEPPVLVRVEPNSPAARAGLRAGDRLTHVDGVAITSQVGWPRFNAIQPGQEVRFTYTRDGQQQQATLSATARPAGG